MHLSDPWPAGVPAFGPLRDAIVPKRTGLQRLDGVVLVGGWLDWGVQDGARRRGVVGAERAGDHSSPEGARIEAKPTPFFKLVIFYSIY